jgi:aminocarboxymuconate-semialdehyde decarboxylase
VTTRPFTVDLHGHVIVPAVEKLVADRPEKRAEPEQMLRAMGAASVEHNARVMMPAIGAKLVNLDARLAELDRMGIDLQVVSPSPNQYYYWADHDLARELVRTQNEAIAEACARHPTRLKGLGNAALQHPELALEQLDHAVKRLGLVGVEVSTSVNGRELADEKHEKFWARAESLGAVVFIHPFGTSLGERMNRFYLQNLIGNPAETAIALSFLIFGGTLDRYPGLVSARGTNGNDLLGLAEPGRDDLGLSAVMGRLRGAPRGLGRREQLRMRLHGRMAGRERVALVDEVLVAGDRGHEAGDRNDLLSRGHA